MRSYISLQFLSNYEDILLNYKSYLKEPLKSIPTN